MSAPPGTATESPGGAQMDLFDPLATEFLDDPYAAYARLRESDPVHWSERLEAWVLTRHSDCLRVVGDTEQFAVDPRQFGEEVPASSVSLQTLDPPDHAKIRRPIFSALRKQDLGPWYSETVAVADRLLKSAANGEFDFVRDFAEPLALRSMCLLFGVHGQVDENAFRTASRAMVLGMDAGLDPSRAGAAEEGRATLNDMIEKWCAQESGSGFIHDLRPLQAAAARDEGPDAARQLINSTRVLFHAGYSSLSSFLGNAAGWLARHRMLDRETLRAADGRTTDELFRLDSAVQAIFRMSTGDIRLGGRRLKRGSGVVALVGAANHDPSVFPEPHRASLARSPNPHLSLGRGVHSCLGGHLAIRVTSGVLRLLAEHFERLEPAAAPLRRPSATLRGLDALPLRAVPAEAGGGVRPPPPSAASRQRAATGARHREGG